MNLLIYCSNNFEELNVGTGMPRGEFSSVFLYSK